MAFRATSITRALNAAPLAYRTSIQRGGIPRLSLRAAGAPRAFSAATPTFAKMYTEEHEWIELDSDGKTGTVGVSAYAAKSLGDVVYVELPQIDQEISAGDTIGAIESVKSASDILSPVTGRIVEANGVLEDKPGTINKSPEGEGWIAKIEVEDVATVNDLMDKAAYDDFTGEPESS